jgi:hypothetical protein
MATATGPNSDLSYVVVESTLAGTTIVPNTFNHFFNVKGVDTTYSTNFSLPKRSTQVGGSILFIIHWNGTGAISFTPQAGSGDSINGGVAEAAVTFTDADTPASLFELLGTKGESSLFSWLLTSRAIRGSGGSSAVAVSPNTQVHLGGIDAGHHLGADTIYLAERGAATPPTLNNAADKVVVVGYRAGTDAGASKVLQNGNVLLGAGAGGGATALASGEICLGIGCPASGTPNRLSVQCEGMWIHTQFHCI